MSRRIIFDHISLFVAIAMVSLCTSCNGQTYIASENIYGTWTGSGTFNNTKIRADVGDVVFNITVNKDNTISGEIGDAKIVESKIMRHVTSGGKDGNTLKCTLQGKVNNDSKFKRKHMKILMYVEGKEEIRTNFFYGGRIGNVTLSKESE